MIVKIPINEEPRFQKRETIAASIPPKKIRPVSVIRLKIVVSKERIPIARMGEKSMLPILSLPLFEKRFRYGSQIDERNFPKAVNFAPGNQVRIMLITHNIV